jgi:hypothetical protein
MEKIVIRNSERIKKMDIIARIQEIADQIAVLIYGKRCSSSLTGILGTAQNLLIKDHKLKEKDIIVEVHGFDEEAAKSADIARRMKYVRSMCEHARRHGIKISVVN